MGVLGVDRSGKLCKGVSSFYDRANAGFQRAYLLKEGSYVAIVARRIVYTVKASFFLLLSPVQTGFMLALRLIIFRFKGGRASLSTYFYVTIIALPKEIIITFAKLSLAVFAFQRFYPKGREEVLPLVVISPPLPRPQEVIPPKKDKREEVSPPHIVVSLPLPPPAIRAPANPAESKEKVEAKIEKLPRFSSRSVISPPPTGPPVFVGGATAKHLNGRLSPPPTRRIAPWCNESHNSLVSDRDGVDLTEGWVEIAQHRPLPPSIEKEGDSDLAPRSGRDRFSESHAAFVPCEAPQSDPVKDGEDPFGPLVSSVSDEVVASPLSPLDQKGDGKIPLGEEERGKAGSDKAEYESASTSYSVSPPQSDGVQDFPKDGEANLDALVISGDLEGGKGESESGSSRSRISPPTVPPPASGSPFPEPKPKPVPKRREPPSIVSPPVVTLPTPPSTPSANHLFSAQDYSCGGSGVRAASTSTHFPSPSRRGDHDSPSLGIDDAIRLAAAATAAAVAKPPPIPSPPLQRKTPVLEGGGGVEAVLPKTPRTVLGRLRDDRDSSTAIVARLKLTSLEVELRKAKALAEGGIFNRL
ncbi:MAG: hypothetical protein JSR76_06420 [Verrucomicrobia bacterium]|nr:hypothetical protein [Verrucomicrobiota bacterium]